MTNRSIPMNNSRATTNVSELDTALSRWRERFDSARERQHFSACLSLPLRHAAERQTSCRDPTTKTSRKTRRGEADASACFNGRIVETSTFPRLAYASLSTPNKPNRKLGFGVDRLLRASDRSRARVGIAPARPMHCVSVRKFVGERLCISRSAARPPGNAYPHMGRHLSMIYPTNRFVALSTLLWVVRCEVVR